MQVRPCLTKCAACAVSVVTAAVCALYLHDLSAAVFYLSVAVMTAAAVFFCALDGEKHTHLARTLLVAELITVTVAIAYIIYFKTGLDRQFSDFDRLRLMILDSGFWGVAVFIGLTIFQVVVLPIPAAVTILLGVAIYGATVSFILSTVGTVIGSIMCFALGKVFGRRLCNWMFGEESTDKYARLLDKKGRLLFIIMLIFPLFPDDMLCMVAGMTEMTYAVFLPICCLTRPIMIGITSYLGSGLIPFEGRGIAIWVAIACFTFVLFVLVGAFKSKLTAAGERRKRG